MKYKIILIFIISFCGSVILHGQEEELKRVDSLLQFLPSKNGIEKLELLSKISRRFLFIDADKALNYARQELQLAIDLGDDNRIGKAYFDIAYCYYRLGKFAPALTNYNNARELYEKSKNEIGTAETKNNIALIYMDLRRHDYALDLLNQLLSFYNLKGMQKNYASVLINVSNIFLDKKNYDEALEGYFKVLEIIKRINLNDKDMTATVYCNIGEAYYGKKQYDLSFKYRKMSLDIYKELNFTDGIANLQMDTGMSLMMLKDFTQAKLYLGNALSNYKSIKFADGIRKTLNNFVLLYRETRQLDEALNNCLLLKTESEANGDSTMLAQSFRLLADIYLDKNEFKLASDYYNKYMRLKEYIESKENKQRLFELQTAFEMEEKEFENKTLRQENELQKEKLNSRENMLLAVTLGVVVSVLFLIVLTRKEKKIKKINEKIQEQNKKLEEHLVSKDKFFSILAHNLKNPFWAVLGQNKMLEDDYEELTEKERKELVKGIGSSAGNVYKLFEDLLKWAKSQQNAIEVEKERLSLRDLINSSIRPYELIAENKKIRLEINVREEIELEGDRFMLETVIGNLVDNAIKFSVQEESVIISGYRTEEGVELKVQDYGMGISQERLENLFKIDEDVTTAGTMNEKGTGLGLIICKEFIEKHNGRIKVESIIGRGTAFSIILPAN
jgi:signal transduction histidine kinase